MYSYKRSDIYIRSLFGLKTNGHCSGHIVLTFTLAYQTQMAIIVTKCRVDHLTDFTGMKSGEGGNLESTVTREAVRIGYAAISSTQLIVHCTMGNSLQEKNVLCPQLLG